MTEPVTKSRTVKYGSTTLGIGSGNAIAYFGLEYLKRYENFTFDDPVVAMAMAGALVSLLLLELRRMGRGFVYVFNRIFPEKYDHEHKDHHSE